LLKLDVSSPSFGVMTMLSDGNSTTIRNVYEYCSSVLRHPISSLHVTTQAGKHVSGRTFDVFARGLRLTQSVFLFAGDARGAW
jgi:hypothetical protein